MLDQCFNHTSGFNCVHQQVRGAAPSLPAALFRLHSCLPQCRMRMSQVSQARRPPARPLLMPRPPHLPPPPAVSQGIQKDVEYLKNRDVNINYQVWGHSNSLFWKCAPRLHGRIAPALP